MSQLPLTDDECASASDDQDFNSRRSLSPSDLRGVETIASVEAEDRRHSELLKRLSDHGYASVSTISEPDSAMQTASSYLTASVDSVQHSEQSLEKIPEDVAAVEAAPISIDVRSVRLPAVSCPQTTIDREVKYTSIKTYSKADDATSASLLFELTGDEGEFHQQHVLSKLGPRRVTISGHGGEDDINTLSSPESERVKKTYTATINTRLGSSKKTERSVSSVISKGDFVLRSNPMFEFNTSLIPNVRPVHSSVSTDVQSDNNGKKTEIQTVVWGADTLPQQVVNEEERQRYSVLRGRIVGQSGISHPHGSCDPSSSSLACWERDVGLPAGWTSCYLDTTQSLSPGTPTSLVAVAEVESPAIM